MERQTKKYEVGGWQERVYDFCVKGQNGGERINVVLFVKKIQLNDK
jgi:hypothetical protein